MATRLFTVFCSSSPYYQAYIFRGEARLKPCHYSENYTEGMKDSAGSRAPEYDLAPESSCIVSVFVSIEGCSRTCERPFLSV